MKPDTSSGEDERFAELLIAYDQALSERGVELCPAEADAETPLGSRLRRAQECLRFIEQVWGHGPPDPQGSGTSLAHATPVPPAAPLKVGRFEVVRWIGRGGGGVVFLAQDPLLQRQVALKLPHPEFSVTVETRRRFIREAQAVAGLSHPNIIPAYEAGEAGAIWYIASEYCAGPTLAGWLAGRRAPVAAAEAASLVATLAEAVQHAHSHGILHRDIKPSNVLLFQNDGGGTIEEQCRAAPQAPSGSSFGAPLSAFVPKLGDFGLARSIAAAEETATDFAMGTAKYMAPEQVQSRHLEVGTHTDVYALGVVLYELLTLQVPFQGASHFEVHKLVCEGEPARPRRLNPRAPQDLEAICLKCLHKRPELRYMTADALAKDLRAFLSSKPVQARTASMTERAGKWILRHPTTAALVASTSVALAAFFCLVCWNHIRLQQHNALLEAAIQGERLQRQAARAQQTIAEHHERLVRRHLYASNIRQVQQLYEGGRLAEARDLLRKQADGFASREPMGFEWYFWWQHCADELVPLSAAPGPVRSLAFSPDGMMLAAACLERSSVVWDLASGRVLSSTPMSRDGIRRVEFLSRDRLFVSNRQHHLALLLDPRSGRILRDFSLGEPGAGAVRWPVNVWYGPNGAGLITTEAEHVKLWQLPTLREVSSFRTEDPVAWIDLSPDGRILAVTSQTSPTVWLYDIASTGEIHRLDGHGSQVFALAFSPDGERLATASGDASLRLWSVSSGRELANLVGHTGEVNAVSWSPRGDLVASTSHDGTARVWDPASARQISQLDAEHRSLLAVAFSPDGKTVALGGDDETVWLWRPYSLQQPSDPMGHALETWCVAFFPDSRLLASASDDHTIRIWERDTCREVASLGGHLSTVSGLAISPDGRMLASASLDGTVKLWEVQTSQTPAGEHVLSARERASMAGHSGRVRCVAFSPDQNTIASGGYDGSIKLWSVPCGELQVTLKGHEKRIRALAFTPDARTLISTSDDGTIRLWDHALESIALILQDTAGVGSMALSPDGQSIATGNSDGMIRIWSARTGELQYTLSGHSQEVRSLAFAPDGNTLASGSRDKTVRLWDPIIGQELTVLTGHAHHVNSVTFSPDAKTLASGSHDGAVKLWWAGCLGE